jgi:hypothetical protein
MGIPRWPVWDDSTTTYASDATGFRAIVEQLDAEKSQCPIIFAWEEAIGGVFEADAALCNAGQRTEFWD